MAIKVIGIFLFCQVFAASAVIIDGQQKSYVSIMRNHSCDDCDKVTCTIYSIEPAHTNREFKKYIASAYQVSSDAITWEDHPEIHYFEDCANYSAHHDEVKMFYFHDDHCETSDEIYDLRTEPCPAAGRIVYLADDAIPHGYCEVNGTVIQEGEYLEHNVSCGSPGRYHCIHGHIEEEIMMGDGVYIHYDPSRYYHTIDGCVFYEDEHMEGESQSDFCHRYHADSCAPLSQDDAVPFAEDLADAVDHFHIDHMHVDLENNATVTDWYWYTHFMHPSTLGGDGWAPGEPNPAGGHCVEAYDNGLHTEPCNVTLGHVCCLIPSYH